MVPLAVDIEFLQLEDASSALKEKEKLVPNISEIYEKKVQDLKSELQKIRDQLKESELKANKPTPQLIQLQKDMEELKVLLNTVIQKYTYSQNSTAYCSSVY